MTYYNPKKSIKLDDHTSDPLYCYRYNPGTQLITRYKITKYKMIQRSNRSSDKSYMFLHDIGAKHIERREVRLCNLDRFIGNKMYSFNPSVSHILTMIYNEVNTSTMKALDTYNKYREQRSIIDHISPDEVVIDDELNREDIVHARQRGDEVTNG